MKSFQELFHKKIIQQKKHQHIDDKTVFHIFSQIIKERYGTGSAYITPKHFAKYTLTIYISKSVWEQEIWMIRKELIDELNQRIGQSLVKKITFSPHQ